MPSFSRRRGFTLIELLVVVAVIAILISILLPALGKARTAAEALQCANNQKSVAQGVANYTVTYQQFPPSYVYGKDRTSGKWDEDDQQLSHPSPTNGYVHWSYALFDGEEGIAEEAFTCPTTLNGGAPATNPGPDPDDWEPNQIDDVGNTVTTMPDFPEDRQAKRVALTGNAAIFPRNKFSSDFGEPRQNQLVNAAVIQGPANMILATEFLELPDWSSILDADETRQGVMKSHRPVTPFIGGSAGTDVYSEPTFGNAAERFFYPTERDLLPSDRLGPGQIVSNASTLNAVGRHHEGSSSATTREGQGGFGGTANFVFVDGHVERAHVRDTVRDRKWGRRFYSLTGPGTKVNLEANPWP